MNRNYFSLYIIALLIGTSLIGTILVGCGATSGGGGTTESSSSDAPDTPGTPAESLEVTFNAHTIGSDTVYNIFAADVDGDGNTDVLSASGSNKIAWHQNVSTNTALKMIHPA